MPDLDMLLKEFTPDNLQKLTSTVKLLRDELDFSEKGYIIIKPTQENVLYLDKHIRFLKRAMVVRSCEKSGGKYKIGLYEHNTDVLNDYLSDSERTQPSKVLSVGPMSNKKLSAKLSFDSASKTIRLTFIGKTLVIKKFTSKRNDNYVMFNHLYLRPNEELTRTQMGVSTHGSNVKDIPKTMGFIGKVKNIFFTIDSKKQTLTLHPEKILSPEEAETIKTLVNSTK